MISEKFPKIIINVGNKLTTTNNMFLKFYTIPIYIMSKVIKNMPALITDYAFGHCNTSITFTLNVNFNSSVLNKKSTINNFI